MEETAFGIGQLVIYSTNGICTVDSIELMSFSPEIPKERYYVLKQRRNEDNKFFVPVENANLTNKMRALMQKEDIDDILIGLSSESVEWMDDRRKRNEYFKSILHDGISSKLLSMITCIYERRRQLIKLGKKLPVSDSNTLKQAEKLVKEEFGFVLGIDQEEVTKYIRKRLHIPEEE